ncbi:hypothetical protein [uncultured Thiodictyon sp.]
MDFKDALTRDTLGSGPYNPFIYMTGDRLRETHLADHPLAFAAPASGFRM